ncbi:phosphate ABC transporter permease subunit PstC [Pararhizobium haloflavum]|uniref:phosphate ABC transporter permease subunit PstC n=1 Tax=Pararhizobium haloflavum TaxID=2037914 RepID=UPI000C18ABF1|nr:phosphate ABC transporter permease subunit PstC [Pararhizobium haloflavum]
MTVLTLTGLILVIALLGYAMGVARSRSALQAGSVLHSRPQYSGAFVAFLFALPAVCLMLAWVAIDEGIIRSLTIASLPSDVTEGIDRRQAGALIREVFQVISGRTFGEPEPYMRDAAAYYVEAQGWSRTLMYVSCLALGALCAGWGFSRIAPEFRARNKVEAIVSGLLVLASCIAILTTVGIIGALVFESWAFFTLVPVNEFLFGLNWEPQIPIREDQIAGAGAFGAVPVFWGTIFIALISMMVALPIGLFSAIYLAEFASPRVRTIVKPVLEILAGIPTIVYGFFAVLTVAPALRRYGEMVGLDVAANSALAAGGVMGIMIIPFISSLSDDAITAVPRSLRDASLAMGATRAETVSRVLLPAALPGIVGGVLLAVSRAIGETMIVVMAAGLIARLTLNPFEGVTTVTVQIVTLLIGDSSFDNPKTLAAFGLGLVLFISTLGLNVFALNIVKKYRERYD